VTDRERRETEKREIVNCKEREKEGTWWWRDETSF